MTLTSDVYRRRLEAMRQRLADVPADGLFATPSSNLFYLTGINFWRSERLTALFLFADRDPVVLCPAFEESRLRGMSAVSNVVSWEETEDPFAKAANLFPGSAGTLAIEPSTAFDDVERLLAGRPGWKAVSGGPLFASVRMIKTPEEQISTRFGGENVVQFGPSSALPHGASTERALTRNQAVLIDAWDKPEGYYYDITRSTWFGEPSDEYRRVWNIVLEAQGAAIDHAAPGVPCAEVDAAARRIIEKAGYGEYFTHRLGHGLGIDVHEPP